MKWRVLLSVFVVLAMAIGATDADARTRAKQNKQTKPNTTKTVNSKAKKQTKSQPKQQPKQKQQAPKRTSEQIRKEKQQNERRIKEAQEQIRKNDREVSKHLNRLEVIKAEMHRRGDSIGRLSIQVDSLNIAISRLNDSINYLKSRHDKLSDAYAHTLSNIRTRRQGMSDLSFIFSASNFSQAWRRMRYLQQVAKAATGEAKRVRQTAEKLEAAKNALEPLQRQHASGLASLQAAQSKQRNEQATADELVKDLKRQGSSLNRELQKRRDQAASLDRELDRIIAAEIEAARKAEEARKAKEEAERKAKAEAERKAKEEAARKAEAEKKQKTPDLKQTKPESTPPAKPATKPVEQKTKTPEPTKQPETSGAVTSGKFAESRGRLIVPVTGKYVVVSGFGTNSHAELSSIKVQNHGIDIKTTPGASALSVFDGVVTSVVRLDGYHNVVIVRHGEYLTVYAGIASLRVKKGDTVKAGQAIGTIFSDPESDNRTVLHFEIRKETQKLNPSEWLRM